MQIERRLIAPCGAGELYPYLDDLVRYPAWMGLVREVATAEAAADEDAAWDVELRAQVGPFARSKRLRMVRTRRDVPAVVVFERAEIDGRDHAPWLLRADLTPTPDGTQLTMTLRYGGSLWAGAVLEQVLDDEVRQGSERLLELVSEEPTR